jgi:hypothetical protein
MENLLLFGTIQLDADNNIIDNLLSDMTYDQAIFLLSEAVKGAHKKGVYTLLESEIISKSIRKIYEVKQEQPEKPEETIE